MSDKPIRGDVLALLEKLLEVPVEGISQNLDEIGMSSMNAIQLIVELETLYNIEFEDSELLFENFNTVEKIIAKVQEKLGSLTI